MVQFAVNLAAPWRRAPPLPGFLGLVNVAFSAAFGYSKSITASSVSSEAVLISNYTIDDGITHPVFTIADIPIQLAEGTPKTVELVKNGHVKAASLLLDEQTEVLHAHPEEKSEIADLAKGLPVSDQHLRARLLFDKSSAHPIFCVTLFV